MPRRYEIIPEDLVCGVCGKKFQGRSSQKYCSPQCKKRAYYQNNQEKLLENRRQRYRESVLEKRLRRRRAKK